MQFTDQKVVLVQGIHSGILGEIRKTFGRWNFYPAKSVEISGEEMRKISEQQQELDDNDRA